jgi:hypothetical protein
VKSILRFVTPAAAATAVAGMAHAGVVPVSGNISVPTTWTADNTYQLQGQVYVLPGASLTIQAGTVIASDPVEQGSLAITNGAQIFVQGTRENPVIFTSTADVATWDADGSHPTGGDPKTGVWREAALEWGNLTIMGDAYISEDATPGNVPTPNPANFGFMEGLAPPAGMESLAHYGGGNDDDDSGTIEYLSLRYGGKVIALTNELNGLSLGGIGRGTDVDFVEVMNNVDDGIETWGGTVNLSHLSVWNIGDDSLDFDQGWRGKAQFALVVQGYSLNQVQGSGVGDNCFEFDGAENCNWQPVTSGVVYNATVVGQPLDGDHGTAWRDNARMQFRNMVFLDVGADLVQNDGDDGDGACGYGGKGLGDPVGTEADTFAELWTTPFSSYYDVNWDMAGAGGVSQAVFYPSMTNGNMAELKDSVIYPTTTDLGDAPVDLTTGFDNVLTATLPIRNLVRGAQVAKGGKQMVPVTKLDPRPVGPAATSVGQAPNDGFFTPSAYRGAIQKNGQNWVWGWTASDAFGFTTIPGTQTVRNSTIAPNPSAFLPGTNAPVVGGIWNPSIDHTSFVPTAFADFIAFGTQVTDIPVPGLGSILIGVAPFTVVPNVAPGTPFTIPIPNQVENVGVTLRTQGGSVQITGAISLANAIDIEIGNE